MAAKILSGLTRIYSLRSLRSLREKRGVTPGRKIVSRKGRYGRKDIVRFTRINPLRSLREKRGYFKV